jgi:hypothetical protein
MRAALERRPTTEPDPLVDALYAAELGHTQLIALSGRASLRLLDELFSSLPQLRASVPYAALRLLEQVAGDPRVAIRTAVAQALPWFSDVYPALVEEILLALAADPEMAVRAASVDALVDLLATSSAPDEVAARFRAASPRVRDVLRRAETVARAR